MRISLLTFALLLATPLYAQIEVVEVLPNLIFSSPVGVGNDGVDANLLYVVERGGVVQVVENSSNATAATGFLDIRDRVSAGGEKGLLGLAFHPDYEENGLFYVYYSTSGGSEDHLSHVSQFTRSDAEVYPPVAEPSSEVVLLEVSQPYSNHNGGGLAFGPDGYLYVSLGDGGSGGDPDENGQDEGTLLGSILRLDVDGGGEPADCGGSAALYTVPADNALFDGPGGACDEIYAWGLRNPWRFSFDRATGQGWIADVGQSQREEIDVMENGGNYGWDVKEGDVCFEAPGPGEPPCNDPSLIDPVWVYEHNTDNCTSITGGYVYRGNAVPALEGKYIYADYCDGRIWALDTSGEVVANEQLDVGIFSTLTSFGEDLNGELYFTRFNGFNDSNGKVFRFNSDTSSSEEPGVPGSGIRLDPVAPNPFVGTAKLTFAVQAAGPAQLVVYDVLGREVARLVDRIVPAGEQTVTFEAGGLPAGMYIVHLKVGGDTAARRMVLTQ